MSILSNTVAVLAKDLQLEWRTRARLNALVFFSLATLLLFSFAGGSEAEMLRKNAAGYLWLAVMFASVLALGESFRVEQENASLDGLRLVPVNARAIFLGKACGNALLLCALSALLVPVMAALFGVSLKMGLGPMALVLLLGCLAISAPGTLYAAISINSRARDVLLPLLLFPLLIPALIAAVKATSLVITGDPQGGFLSWLGLLTGFNLLYWGLGFALFPQVIED